MSCSSAGTAIAPYCNPQLRGLQRTAEELAEVGAKVVTLRVDDEATTAATIAKHGVSFPAGHSADASAISAATGAFVDPERGFLQSTGVAVKICRLDRPVIRPAPKYRYL